MNHNEPGFQQETIKGRRSSEIPVRALVRQKGKHLFHKASSDAYAEKKYAYILTARIPFRSALSNSIADQLTRWGEMLRLVA
jgi:hypothetical protein